MTHYHRFLLLLGTLLSSYVIAQGFEVNGINYEVGSSNTTVLVTSGNYSGNIIIPETVTYNGTVYTVSGIGTFAFLDCSKLTNVTIPNTVTFIGYAAFCRCTSLNSITIPNSVVSIDWEAFEDCSGLTSLTLSNSIKMIGPSVFSGCSGLTNVTIPNSVTTIDHYAFSRCTGLTSINIGDSVTSIIGNPFSRCSNLTHIEVSSNNPAYDSRNNCNAIIETSSNSLILGCTNTIIPNGIKSIGEFAFEGCTSLSSITIPNSVRYIGSTSFSGCIGLTNVILGSSVTSIGDDAFMDCNSIENIYSYAINPPTCGSNPFSTYVSVLHVPPTSLASYFTAPYWCNFEIILGDAPIPESISISHNNVELAYGDQFELFVTTTNISNEDVIWESTNNSVATVSKGTISAVGVGECDIIASYNNMEAICHVSVFQKISLDQQEAKLLPNHMLTLTPSASPITIEGFIATSSDPTVAAARVLNDKIQVVGIKEGTTIITVGSANGTAIPASCLVTVYTEPGDVNCDGFVDINDVTSTISFVLGDEVNNFKTSNADVYSDGFIDINDVTTLINIILGNGN